MVLFEEYASSYPYAEDGRIPAPSGTGLLEPLTTLSFLAAHTTTTRLGTAMLLLPQRNPVYTAKEVSTLDWLSNGRVDLGIGVGWLEEEFNAVNVPWPSVASGPTSTSRSCAPCGATRPRPTRASSTRSTRARCSRSPSSSPIRPSTSAGSPMPPSAGWPGPARGGTPSTGPRTQLAEPLATLDGLLADEGRTRADVTITVCPYFQPLDGDIAGQYAEAGVDAVAALLLAFSEDDVRKALDDLQPVFDRAARRS